MEELEVGREVIGRFHYGRAKGQSPMLAHPHGHITEIIPNGFKAYFPEIKTTWQYKESDIGKIVYLSKEDTRKIEEHLDYRMEKERLGIEE